MATFIKLQNKSGVTYRAVIRRKGLGRPITKVFKTKTAARKWAERIEGDGELARALGDGRLRSKTVSDLIDAYLKGYAGKDKSRRNQLQWWKQRIGSSKLVDVDSDLIQDQLDVLRSTPALQPKRGKEGAETARKRSPATLNRFQSSISAVFQHAINNRDMRANPARGIGRGQETHRFGRCLSDDERTALLAACKASGYDRLYLLVTMALSTAARLGELLSLSWADLDLKKNLAILAETKNGSPRQLPLIPAIVDQLQALPRPIDSDTLLFRSLSDPHRPYDFRPHWVSALNEAGIESFRFHDLRHTAATLLTESDINDVTLAAILGHKTMAMVQRYSHARVQRKAEAVRNTFDRILG